jgi:hypothetical protein
LWQWLPVAGKVCSLFMTENSRDSFFFPFIVGIICNQATLVTDEKVLYVPVSCTSSVIKL